VAVHPAEDVGVYMLYRNVDVSQQAGVFPEFPEQPVGDFVGVAVEQPDPRDGGLCGNPADQLVEAVVAVDVEAVAGSVLRD